MKLLIASMILAAPTLAMAQDIPKPVLAQQYQNCLTKCTASRGRNYCEHVCTCVNNEYSQHVSAAHFKALDEALTKNPNDKEANNEVHQMVAYCAEQAGK